MLNKCRRQYGKLTPETAGANPRIIGIDVGTDLHYIVRDVVKEDGMVVKRLLELGRMPTFEMVHSEVLKKWNPRIAVIDADPEIHKVMELKAKYPRLWSARFRKDQQKLVPQDDARELTIDRTAILDFVQQWVDSEQYLLPEGAEFLDDGIYYDQMASSTRILTVDEEKPDKAYFEWVHTQPDHYFLAEAYCAMAFMRLPNIDGIMEFFKTQTGVLRPEIGKIKGISDEQRKELGRQSLITPQEYLRNLQTRYADKTKKK
jgi:hypothetical protein